MKPRIKNFVGIDIGSEEFTATIFQKPGQPVVTSDPIENTGGGFAVFGSWLKKHGVSAGDSIVCLEATGVYGVFHYLVAQGFTVAVEPPLKVKRAFDTSGHKNDSVDSAQIAEYAYRFRDELRVSSPRPESVERLKHALTAREQMVKHSVATKNSIAAYHRHVVQDPKILELHQRTLSHLKEQIAAIDAHIKQIVKRDPSLHQLSQFLVSLCGVGILLAAYLLVTSNAFQDITTYKQMAAFLGICPYEFKSGTSILRRSRCRHYGPRYARKLLHLAARSVATHNPHFRKYYLRKLEEGKNKQVALNNIANKLLKIAFALIKNKQPYIHGYRSVNPMLLKNT